MRDILIGIAIVAAGVHLAVWPTVAAWMLIRPAPSITVDLGEYACATDGKTVECVRK